MKETINLKAKPVPVKPKKADLDRGFVPMDSEDEYEPLLVYSMEPETGTEGFLERNNYYDEI